ncbi:MAG: D-alanine--D-alanine ligase [Ruminococcus sp.]|nr:D-alanine--D-alanine ligase [Ruminococcus sp.]
MKLAVLFGGRSNEHEVSTVSASSILENLDKEKYDITPIYLDKENNFYKWLEPISNIKTLKIGELPHNLEKISNSFEYLKTFDLVFIMIHGKDGEDGVFSSILDFLNIKYIGNSPLSSTLTMDKILTKEILENNNIKTSKYMAITKYNNEYLYKDLSLNIKDLINKIEETLNYPLFVKPSRSGSSLGISKANNKKELEEAINIALNTDSRLVIEEMIIGKELECAILEKDNEVMASCVGEVKAADTFYSFDAKYKNTESLTIIPASISDEDSLRIREAAKKVFKILNCHGYSRCDFFLTNSGEVILNEINTIPGFTEISMYPKLWESSGIKYNEVLDILINEAIK